MTSLVDTYFRGLMYNINHLVNYGDYAAAGKAKIKEWNDSWGWDLQSTEWFNYLGGVASKFGRSFSEFVGFITSNYIIGEIIGDQGTLQVQEDPNDFVLFVERLDGLAKIIESFNLNAACNLELNDLAGQREFQE